MPHVSILLVVFLYLYLFNPSFLFFTGNLHFGNFFSIVAIFLFFSKSKVVSSYIKMYRTEFVLVLYLLMYSVFRSGIDGETPIITQHVIGLLNIFIIVPIIVEYIKKKSNDSTQYLMRCLLVVGAVGSVITLLCFLSPDINMFTKKVLMRYSTAELNNEMNDYRGFGFASLLSSDYGYIMGILLVIGCYYYKNNTWFLFFMPLLFLSTLVNARTGLVIAIIGIFLFLIYNRNYKFTLILFLMCIIIYHYVEQLMSLLNFNEYTLMWLTSEFESTGDAIRSGDMNQSLTLTALFSDFWILPDNMGQWIMGRGFDLYRNTRGVPHSDVGWIRELNYGGLFYLIPLMYLFWTMFKRLCKHTSKTFALFVLITICIINTKAMIFPGERSFYAILMIYYMLTPRKQTLRIPVHSYCVSGS